MTSLIKEKPKRKYTKYWREIVIVSLLIWIIAGNRTNARPETPSNDIQEIDMVVEEMIIWEGLDALSFSEAFNQIYDNHGEGHIFDWRGKVYLTKLAE